MNKKTTPIIIWNYVLLSTRGEV